MVHCFSIDYQTDSLVHHNRASYIISDLLLLLFRFQDGNDFSPDFERSSYTAPSLLENVPVGTDVITVTAVDGDPDVSVWRKICDDRNLIALKIMLHEI